MITLPIVLGFNPAAHGMQFVEKLPWIPRFNVFYHLGIDGLSLWFVPLTAFITVLVVIAGWEVIEKRVAQYFGAFLILSGAMIGVFCAVDALLFFVFFGRTILDLFGLSDSALNIAGGVILFLIAIRLIFQHPEGAFGTDSADAEPFIVPLAIPSIAGPSAIATIVLVVSRSPERITDWIMALAIASTITLLLLLAADRIARHIGRRGLAALDRMMGLVLTAIAVEMLLKGIESFVRGL